MKGTVGIALGVAFAVGVACGGDAPPIKYPDPRENEITTLWTQIRGFRRDMGMHLDPTAQTLSYVAPLRLPDAKKVCSQNHPVPTTCNEVCGLADDICDNAERICQIADELGKGDEYAQDKCKSAKASCREAQQKCCECSGATP